MSKQPEALRLADALECGTYLLSVERDITAAELRRLHEVNVELLEALKMLLDDITDYQTINNLGGANNHSQVQARAAIAKATGETK